MTSSSCASRDISQDERENGNRRGEGVTEDDKEEYLRVGEAAAALHVSRQTLTRWARQGKVPFSVTIGGHRRFARSVIERLRWELESR